jgi:hypothetical protein
VKRRSCSYVLVAGHTLGGLTYLVPMRAVSRNARLRRSRHVRVWGLYGHCVDGVIRLRALCR